MNRVALLIASIFIVLGLSSVHSQEKYLLKNAIPDGHYKIEQNLLVSLIISSEETSSVSQTKTKFFWNVTVSSPDSASHEIIMKPKRIMYQYAPDGVRGDRLVYDSDHSITADKKLDSIYRVFIDSEFRITMDAQYNVVKVEGLKEVWDKIAENSSKEVQKIAQSLQTSITETSFADAFNQFNYGIPKVEVAVNDSWETSIATELPLYGKTETIWKNTLDSVREENGRKYYVIQSNSSFVLEQNDADVENTITAEYDLETGLNRKYSNYSKVTVEQDVELDGKIQTIKSVALIRGNQTIAPQ